ncbi:actin family [Sphaerosporella brunnea]|uniref:Actin-like protein ARP6 n=1 Tax=Sphaerosporella brunnea TaxID=1250544 RepID=A0A5J5EZY7_9PEZI|nr:actin family [Sphaerosporella brunnea]
MPPRTLIVDNGAYTIKTGFLKVIPSYSDCHLIPNCIARSRDRRSLVGTQLETCRDFGGMAFRRPVEKGYLVNWEAEKEIWDRTFLEPESPVYVDAPSATTLVLTEAPNAPLSLQNNTDQIVFEEYEFAEYLRYVGPATIPWNDLPALFSGQPPTPPPTKPAEAALIVDTGFSHTHIYTTLLGQPWNSATRRIDIGGKFLTNYLKELVSLRTWNMMEEPYLISQVKEAVCFVSTDFSGDLERCKRLRLPQNPIVRDYVLPDYNTGKGGFARNHIPKQRGPAAPDDEQVMVLGNERFAVPELLFNPADVGLKQAGVVECVLQALEMVPERMRPVLLANIVLTGGNANIPGFQQRFEQELRPLAPSEAAIRVAKPHDPEKFVWLGAARMACDEEFMKRRKATRKEYMEHGLLYCQKKMAGEDVRAGGEVAVKDTATERDRRENRTHRRR